MSYVPSHQGGTQTVAAPDALTILEGSLNQSASAATTVKWGTIRNEYGSFSPSVTSAGVITLPSGYHYFLEGGVQANVFSNGWLQYMFYTTAYVGSRAHCYPYGAQDLNWQAADEVARVMIDATSSSVDIYLHIYAGSFANNPVLNQNSGTEYEYVGFGRCVIWRLS